MNRLEAMQIYARVAELASFTQAADSLGLPKASVSTGVRQLEAELGTRLLHRTTRKVQMTQDGQAFYERCKDLLADLDELQSMFQQGEQALTGRLRVDMASSTARRIVIPALPAFLAAHPRLEIELSCADRRVDLVREGFDCVLRVGAIGDPSLIAKPLGHFRMRNLASPDYLARFGTPTQLEDLARHRVVHYVQTLGTKPVGWEYQDGDENATFPMAGIVTVNNTDAYYAACLAGLGIIQTPLVDVEAALDAGRLVEVLPAYHPKPMPVSLVYANRRHLPKRVQAFMAWMAEILQPHLV